MKLFLHIGSPKTGSTSIQKFLGEQIQHTHLAPIEALGGVRARKLPLLCEGGKVSEKYSRSRYSRQGLSLEEATRDTWKDLETEVRTSERSAFFASEEAVVSTFETDQTAMIALADKLLQIFESVQIIYYVRDQRDFLKSWYSQAVAGKTQETKSYRRFIQEDGLSMKIADYSSVANHWASVFGPEAMTVKVFHRDSFLRGNLIYDLLATLEVDTPEVLEASLAAPARNVRSTALQLALLRQANKLGVNKRTRKALRRSGLLRSVSSRSLPDDMDAQILDRFSDSNAAINAAFLANSPVALPVAQDDETRSDGPARRVR